MENFVTVDKMFEDLTAAGLPNEVLAHFQSLVNDLIADPSESVLQLEGSSWEVIKSNIEDRYPDGTVYTQIISQYLDRAKNPFPVQAPLTFDVWGEVVPAEKGTVAQLIYELSAELPAGALMALTESLILEHNVEKSSQVDGVPSAVWGEVAAGMDQRYWTILDEHLAQANTSTDAGTVAQLLQELNGWLPENALNQLAENLWALGASGSEKVTSVDYDTWQDALSHMDSKLQDVVINYLLAADPLFFLANGNSVAVARVLDSIEPERRPGAIRIVCEKNPNGVILLAQSPVSLEELLKALHTEYVENLSVLLIYRLTNMGLGFRQLVRMMATEYPQNLADMVQRLAHESEGAEFLLTQLRPENENDQYVILEIFPRIQFRGEHEKRARDLIARAEAYVARATEYVEKFQKVGRPPEDENRIRLPE